MNEETQEKANQVLTALIESAATVRDFAIEQAPDVIQQLLMWNLISSLLSFCIGVILIGMLCYLNWKQYKWIKNGGGRVQYGYGNFKSEKELDPSLVANLFQIFPIVIIGLWIYDSMDWLKICLAPKLYLIEYATDLIK